MPPGNAGDSALAPPVARTGDNRRDPFGWIAEPTAELIDLLDAERAYYESRIAPLAELRAELAAEMAARVPDEVGVRAVAVGGLHLPRNPRGRDRIPHPCAPHGDGRGRIGDRPAGGRRRPPRRGVPPLASARSAPTGRCWPGRTTSSATSGMACGSATWLPAADLPGVIESTFPSGGWSADSRTYLYLRTDARQSAASGVGAFARHRSCDGSTGLHRTRRAVRSQRGCHPLGRVVRHHRIVAKHHRGPRAVVRGPCRAHRYSCVLGRISSSISSSTRRAPKAIASSSSRTSTPSRSASSPHRSMRRRDGVTMRPRIRRRASTRCMRSARQSWWPPGARASGC